MAPPLLVIEVVSPGEIPRERDYIAKRTQYQDCGIPEYWIVDPQTKTILVLELDSDKFFLCFATDFRRPSLICHGLENSLFFP